MVLQGVGDRGLTNDEARVLTPFQVILDFFFSGSNLSSFDQVPRKIYQHYTISNKCIVEIYFLVDLLNLV